VAVQDFVSPVTAAQTMLHSACKKRKEMLQKTMGLLLQIIQATAQHARLFRGCTVNIGREAGLEYQLMSSGGKCDKTGI
jgi:hypothetical protein